MPPGFAATGSSPLTAGLSGCFAEATGAASSFARFHREFGNHLRLAIVEKLKIVGCQIAGRMAAAVANHHGNRNQIHAGFKCKWGVFRCHFGGWRRWSLRGEERTEE